MVKQLVEHVVHADGRQKVFIWEGDRIKKTVEDKVDIREILNASRIFEILNGLPHGNPYVEFRRWL